jgi:integrase
MSKFNKTRNRALDATELGVFLRRVETMLPGAARDALRCLLLLGGQRPVQLLRLERTHVDLPGATVTLYDRKGRRTQPRSHVLPVVREVKEILERRLATGDRFIFSTDGEHAMRVETLGAAVGGIVEKMLAANPPEARSEFQTRDLRRTCETMLAGLKVSSDVRAQLLSHGLGGVQQRHYNMHEYALEKKQALEKWARHLEKLRAGEGAKVLSIAKVPKHQVT